MGLLFSLFGGLLGWLLPMTGLGALVFLLRQRKGQEEEIPPLDLMDGKKLSEMVSNQVEQALKPFLSSEGYDEEQIQAILTRSSLGGTRFKR
jgi:hypothetical protein